MDTDTHAQMTGILGGLFCNGHTYQRYETTTATSVPFPQLPPEELKIDMFKKQEQTTQEHSPCQQNKGTSEVEYSQRLTRLPVLGLGSTGA